MTTKEITQIALNATMKNGGATIHADTGEEITKGFSVGGVREFKVNAQDLKKIGQAVAIIRYQYPECHVGFWMHEGTLYVDAVRIVETAEEAQEIAQRHNELAYYDMNTNTTEFIKK